MARTWILHVDLDQFLAAVEVLRRPELTGRPVVVGGDGNPRRPRQVVATASYEARAFGVHSGMPLMAAYRKCPDAVFLPSDHPAYDAASAEVMATLRSMRGDDAEPVVVEVWGWDEAFVGVSTDDPEAFARRVRAEVLAATRLSCAVGIGETRLQAKTATGFAKRQGTDARVARLTRAEWIPTMGDEPVTAIWGIGTRTAARLAEAGIHTVVDLARADHEDLARRFGPRIGPSLRVLGLGGDASPLVDEPWVPKSRSKEVTYTRDVVGAEAIGAEVDRLAREVTAEVTAGGFVVTHVAVKLRTPTFFTRTRISKLPAPTTESDEIAATARRVLTRFDAVLGTNDPARPRAVRLIGVRLMLQPAG
jgi:DNA polymerase-4